MPMTSEVRKDPKRKSKLTQETNNEEAKVTSTLTIKSCLDASFKVLRSRRVRERFCRGGTTSRRRVSQTHGWNQRPGWATSVANLVRITNTVQHGGRPERRELGRRRQRDTVSGNSCGGLWEKSRIWLCLGVLWRLITVP